MFIDDSPNPGLVNGHAVLRLDEFALDPTHGPLVIAIAGSLTRGEIVLRCEALGLEFMTVVASTATVLDEVTVGEGTIICHQTMISSNTIVGRHVHCNYQTYIAHDCIVGDYVTFAPGVKCNGNVIIEDHAYIGAGAMIKHGTPEAPLVIGAGARIGMGAVVTSSVPAGHTVIGNPARPMDVSQF